MPVVWNGPAVVADVNARTKRAILRSSILLRNTVFMSLQAGNVKGTNPSSPGQSPHKITGHLANDIAYEIVNNGMTGRVGFNLKYGLALELGAEAHVVEARPGKALLIPVKTGRVAGPKTKARTKQITSGEVIFRKRVNIPALAPRPFMRPSLRHAAPFIEKEFSEAKTNQ